MKLAPVPLSFRDMGGPVVRWLQSVIDRCAPASTTYGTVKRASAIADLNQTISNPPTQAEVQAISNKIDALLAAQRTAGQLES